MRPLLVSLALLAAVYLAVIVLVWMAQERVVWQPPRVTAMPEAAAQRLSYSAEDGQPLYAYLLGDARHAPGLLIAFHGNAELAAWNVSWAAEAARRTGWAVLLPEYRGYGGLGGSPDYVGSQRDARAALALARAQVADSTPIAYFGHSLGSAVAAELAATRRPAALILLAPFSSARDMARAMPGLPLGVLWGTIGRIRFDTRARVAALDAPVFVAHGERDAVVPVRMGREVYAAARMKGALLLVPGAGHNDVPSVAGDAYWRWLADALAASASNR